MNNGNKSIKKVKLRKVCKVFIGVIILIIITDLLLGALEGWGFTCRQAVMSELMFRSNILVTLRNFYRSARGWGRIIPEPSAYWVSNLIIEKCRGDKLGTLYRVDGAVKYIFNYPPYSPMTSLFMRIGKAGPFNLFWKVFSSGTGP